jgi:hypothetical protein
MNQRVVELGFEIERGEREAHPDNSLLMIETYKQLADKR